MIDTRALERHVQMALNAGVSGFLVPAMASEVYSLKRHERQLVVDTVLQHVNGRVPVIGGAGETGRTRRAHIVQDLLDLGCTSVLLQIPYRSADQYRADVFRIAEMPVEMIMLQDWHSTGYGLPLELICDLFETVESFRCLKIETVPAGPKYSEVLSATEGRLHVSGGWAVTQMIEALQRGVHAFMPTGLHEIYTTIYRLFHNGHHQQAREWFEAILPVLAFANQHLDISIQFFKRLLFRQGIYPTPHVRESHVPFDAVHEQTADALIERSLQLITSCQELEEVA